MPKNECLKRRPVYEPYEVWANLVGWQWRVLKKYQYDDAKPHARWMCFVTSPMCPHGEHGDVYAAEVMANAIRVQ